MKETTYKEEARFEALRAKAIGIFEDNLVKSRELSALGMHKLVPAFTVALKEAFKWQHTSFIEETVAEIEKFRLKPVKPTPNNGGLVRRFETEGYNNAIDDVLAQLKDK